MIAAIMGITIERGATYKLALQLADERKGAYSLPDYKAEMRIRDEAGRDLVLCTVANGRVEVDENSIIRITIPAIVTRALVFQKGVFNVDLISPEGEIFRMARGPVKVNPVVLGADPVFIVD